MKNYENVSNYLEIGHFPSFKECKIPQEEFWYLSLRLLFSRKQTVKILNKTPKLLQQTLMYQAAAFCFKYTSVSPIKSINYISIYLWFILEETSRKKFLSKRSYSITILSTTFIQEYIISLEKEMATHSSILAQRIPGMGEPGGLPSLGSHKVGHD